MPTPKLPLDGGCRCGRIRIRVTKPALLTMACHCTGCQRMTSSAFSISAAFPGDAFAVTHGEPVICGLHGDNAQHYGCSYCMSWMFTRIPHVDRFVNVRSTMLDDTRWIAPLAETYTSEKLPWASTSARHSYSKFPEMREFETLMKEYAAQNG